MGGRKKEDLEKKRPAYETLVRRNGGQNKSCPAQFGALHNSVSSCNWHIDKQSTCSRHTVYSISIESAGQSSQWDNKKLVNQSPASVPGIHSCESRLKYASLVIFI